MVNYGCENDASVFKFFLYFGVLLLCVMFSTSNVNSSYFYNDSFVNITVDDKLFCIDMDSVFTVYTQSDYENKKEIESNLCVEGCVEDCDSDDDTCIECENNCMTFEDIAANVKLFDGPFDNSEDLLLDVELDDKNSFTYFFNKTNSYLLEIFPSDDFNDYHTIINSPSSDIVVNDCNIKTSEELKASLVPSVYDVDFSYLDSKILLSLVNSSSENSSLINVEIVNPSVSLENIDIAYKFSSSDLTFSNMDLKISYENDGSILDVYKLNNNKWDNVVFEQVGDNLILNSIQMGTYAITKEEVAVVDVVEEPDVNVNVSADVQGADLSQNDDVVDAGTNLSSEVIAGESSNIDSSSSSNTMVYVGIGVVLLLVIGIVLFVILSNSNSKPTNVPKVEILTTYQETYNRTLAYVNKYKDKFLRDQIYRALKEAKIPRDIIDKVFDEVF